MTASAIGCAVDRVTLLVAGMPAHPKRAPRGLDRAQWTVMLYWTPHKFAHPHEGQLDLRQGDKVRSTVALRGVPAGTKGKVILANGFQWQRYRVIFNNGAEVGDLDHRNIEPVGRAARRIERAAKVAARGG